MRTTLIAVVSVIIEIGAAVTACRTGLPFLSPFCKAIPGLGGMYENQSGAKHSTIRFTTMKKPQTQLDENAFWKDMNFVYSATHAAELSTDKYRSWAGCSLKGEWEGQVSYLTLQ